MKSSLRCMLMKVWILLVLLFLWSNAETLEIREEIIANREKRHRQLTNVLERTEKMVKDHFSGAKPLTDEKLHFMQTKIGAYKHQLEELGRELDEEELEIMVERREQRLRDSYRDEL